MMQHSVGEVNVFLCQELLEVAGVLWLWKQRIGWLDIRMKGSRLRTEIARAVLTICQSDLLHK